MLALDHIVIAGNDAETASAQYGNQFTVKAIKGGEHTNWGTYNYLSYFSNDSYLEWLGISDLAKAHHAENPLIQHLVFMIENDLPGPFQFALRTNNIDNYVTHFEKQNIPYTGPIEGNRQKPDGTTLKWRMLFPQYNHTEEILPFLIEWENLADVYPDASLLNLQTINTIHYNGINREEFARIYQLKPKKLNKNLLTLQNCKIRFNEVNRLNFDLV